MAVVKGTNGYRILITHLKELCSLVSTALAMPHLSASPCSTVWATVSNPDFDRLGSNRTSIYLCSFLGAVNFLFGLPAIRTIDTLGRRKWLILTLPLMCLAMLGAALSAALITDQHARVGIMAFFLYCKQLHAPLPPIQW